MGRPPGKLKKNVVAEPGLDAPASPFSLQNFVKSLAKENPDSELQLLGAGSESRTFGVKWWIPTGLLSLDYVMGGGIPSGRVIEIFSNNPSEGKTAHCALFAAAVQKAGGLCLLIDTESGVLIERLITLGVNTDDLVIAQPSTMEEVFNTIHIFIEEIRKQGFTGPLVAIWDSVAATATQSQLEAPYDQNLYAPQARVLSSGLRKLLPVLRESDATLICANQVRETMATYGEQRQSVGGMGLRFYATVRLGLSKVSNVKTSTNEITGIEVSITAKKNKITRPFKKATYVLNFKNGFDHMGSEFAFAREMGLIVENGKGYYSFVDNADKKFRESAYPEYRTNEFVEKLKSMVRL